MKKLLPVIAFFLFIDDVSAQFVARREIKDSDSINNLCNKNDVFAMFPMFKGQEEAVCPVSREEINKRLNEIPWLKENEKAEDEGMVNIIINCKGEVVHCAIDNKTKSPELDAQIVAVFKGLGDTWKPAKLNKKEVDSSTLWSFKIKKGKISLNR
jgi:hypothetical protein